jgi:hypothetical protein
LADFLSDRGVKRTEAPWGAIGDAIFPEVDSDIFSCGSFFDQK